jgi:hypothetical protein
MADDPAPERFLDAVEERRLAVDLFNEVWRLMEHPARDASVDDRMLHAAHASRYHWGEVGEPVNLVRGEWQCSRVYAVLGRPEPAAWHARRCLELCQEHDIADFDLAYAYEALTRAARIAGDAAAVATWAEQARAAGGAIAEDDDRELFEKDLASAVDTA